MPITPRIIHMKERSKCHEMQHWFGGVAVVLGAGRFALTTVIVNDGAWA
ncbi:MAG: hypothetical protein JSU94_10990 [Phycisphaerales bacterium]|nr:MAG: hypothetical protein JSU94_10990 [Phycisphaerales bacterium]